MEIIALILIIIFVFANANDKKKKRRNASVGQQVAKDAVTPAGRMSREERQERMRQLRQQQAARREKVASGALGGAMARLQKTMEELDAALQPSDASVTPRRPEPVARAVDPTVIRQGQSMLDDDDCHGGSMPHTHAEGHSALEDEDCYGGSMEHTHTEGISRSAHERRMAAIDEARDEDVLPEAIDAAALRRAVVMAEVLGKPKALRRI